MRNAFAVVLLLVAPLAAAQAPYPSKPIRIIAAFAPGSTLDIMARIIGPKLSESMGQPVIVENRSGAGGMIGMEVTAKAAPDGYTLGVGALGPSATNPALYAKTPFDPVKDFTGVTLLATGPVAIVTHPSVPAKTLKELIALAKARPGQLNYGSPGVGTSPHLAGELFQSVTGTKMVHVPYKGNPEALNDLIGGQLTVVFTGVPPVVQFVKAGRIRALAVTGKQRNPSLPDTPTVGEAGYPGAEMVIWYGIVAPGATPKNIVARLNAEIVKAMKLPDVRERFAGLGTDPVTSSPEEFSALIRNEYARWSKLIKAAGIKAE
ncbi:MAG TPA: tripartite tricarboxylate transporter substrate binding protein [Burkholderiales bacterium]|nr:tripartite tricarboxylate transporter substrate binding protein [Burkholderiales bacterium]